MVDKRNTKDYLLPDDARQMRECAENGVRGVFLGGTCNGSKWRDDIVPKLDRAGLTYFDPVVPDWTPACQAEELVQRETCEVCLYVITPKMSGMYAVAEVVDDSNKRPLRTVLCILSSDGGEGWTESQAKSMRAVAELVARNKAAVFYSLDAVVEYLKLTRVIR